jgi:ribosome maturation factor RimP
MEWASCPFFVCKFEKCGHGRTLFDLRDHGRSHRKSKSAAMDGRFLISRSWTIAQVQFMRNEELTELLAPVVADLGLECLGVEYSPSHGNGLVRVYIDAADRAVTVEDCEAVSRQISATLDVHDPVQGRYTLEVSSPGFDRPLFTAEQFARFIGSAAKLELNLPLNGRRRFQGPILSAAQDGITIEQDGVPVSIAPGNIHKARLVPEQIEKPGKVHKGKKEKKSKSEQSVRHGRTQEQQA